LLVLMTALAFATGAVPAAGAARPGSKIGNTGHTVARRVRLKSRQLSPPGALFGARRGRFLSALLATATTLVVVPGGMKPAGAVGSLPLPPAPALAGELLPVPEPPQAPLAESVPPEGSALSPETELIPPEVTADSSQGADENPFQWPEGAEVTPYESDPAAAAQEVPGDEPAPTQSPEVEAVQELLPVPEELPAPELATEEALPRLPILPDVSASQARSPVPSSEPLARRARSTTEPEQQLRPPVELPAVPPADGLENAVPQTRVLLPGAPFDESEGFEGLEELPDADELAESDDFAFAPLPPPELLFEPPAPDDRSAEEPAPAPPAPAPAAGALDTEYQGVNMRTLADAFTGIESGSERYRALGAYVCDGAGNCGFALGRYQVMSYHEKLVARVAPQPGGPEFLARLGSGEKVSREELLQYLPPELQDQIFVDLQMAGIDQAQNEIDPQTGAPFAGLRLVERLGQIHFGGTGAPIDGSASDVHGRLTLKTYGEELASSYAEFMQTPPPVVAAVPPAPEPAVTPPAPEAAVTPSVPGLPSLPELYGQNPEAGLPVLPPTL
jgi:hypothetical protein